MRFKRLLDKDTGIDESSALALSAAFRTQRADTLLIGNYTRNITDDTKLFFVHVPKTGGTAVNVFFRNVFGALHTLIHAESLLLAPETREQNCEVCRRNNFVSAHLPFDFYSVHFRPFGFKAIVTIRDPIEYFISQINHLARSNNFLHDTELSDARARLKKDPNEFFHVATMERLEFFSAQQSKAIFGSVRNHIPRCALSRVGWLIENYDTVLLSSQIYQIGDFIEINGSPINFKVSTENVKPESGQLDIIITDKIKELLYEDILLYDEMLRINEISSRYWRQLIR